MPKPETVRFSLELNPTAAEALEQLAEEIHGSKSDVLRRAIALLQVAVRAKKEGLPFGIGEKGQKLGTEIVGI